MRSAREALTAIETEILGSELPVNADMGRAQRAALVRILSDVEPEPAAAWDRDAARVVMRTNYPGRDAAAVREARLDALEACVRPAPAQTIDRDSLAWAISDVLMRVYDNGTSPNARREAEEVVPVVLALLRPVDGVTLTREEAAHAADWHDYIVDQGGEVPPEETELALRLRAGAAS